MSQQTQEDLLISSAVLALPVVIPAYASATSGNALYQNSSIELDLPDALYAKEVQHVPAPEYAVHTLTDTYSYMGSRGRYHYIMHTPVIGLRKVLKIERGTFTVDKEFPLTSHSSEWQHLSPKNVPLKFIPQGDPGLMLWNPDPAPGVELYPLNPLLMDIYRPAYDQTNIWFMPEGESGQIIWDAEHP